VKKTADCWLGIFIFSAFVGLATVAWADETPSKTASKEDTLRIGVIGDTGIGERAFHAGFLAVQKALRESHPDVLLHLGDFVYQPKFQPQSCPDKYIREIRNTLVEPFPLRLFVPGDNDLPPHLRKPKASGCWSRIDPLDTPFDDADARSEELADRFEGTKTIGNTFIAILNTYPWKDPTKWLAPKIKAAKKNGLWIIVALHEPAITTAWYLDKRNTVLKQVNALQPDLVFSGNQHSYERFHQLGIPEAEKKLPVRKSASFRYRRGEGTIHIVSGGGGATFKPFADQQGIKDRTAPRDVFNALAKRALMNHYIILEISSKVLKGVTYRVCPGKDPTGKSNPRWKPHKFMWENITLECEKKPAGVAKFDRFEITR
jgi:calcineurin-like phosphoesterase family protein